MRAPWVRATVIVLAACSTRSPCQGRADEADRAVAAERERACTDWATHYCNRLQLCAPVSVQTGYETLTHCIARNLPGCLSSLRAEDTGARVATVQACAGAYDAASCDDVVVGRAPQACRVSGARSIGARCGDSAQCAGADGYCRMAADEACGRCSRLGAAGDGCDSDRDCQYGLVCYFTCMAPMPMGAACDGMKTQCSQTALCLNYVCSAPRPLSAPCSPAADPCDHDQGLFCDADTKTCQPYSVVAPGAACGAGTLCRGGACTSDDDSSESRCLANAEDGAKCDPVDGPPCAEPARCVDGACVLPDPAACR